MKGKGKGGDRDKSDKAEKSSSAGESKETTLNFPDLSPVNHIKLCPRYSAILQRSEADGVGLEDTNILQTELETLLSSVAKRMRQLEAEIQLLNNVAEKNCKAEPEATPPKTLKKGGKVQPEKRSGGKGSEEKPSKKFKEAGGKAKDVQPKSKGKGQGEGMAESPKPAELPRLPKNDIPNRFWAMVEPYCTEITSEDLKVLEEIMKSHEDDAEYHKVPGLGKHYSQKWALEDLQDEQKEGSKLEKRRSAATNNSINNSNECKDILKRVEDRSLDRMNNDDGSSLFGPLTQRLVAALIEENIMTPLDDSTELEKDAAEAACMSPRSLAKQLNIGNAASLERRIKRELEEQGILDADDKPNEDPHDEILSELRRRQNELRVLSQHNMMLTKRLFKLAKEEMTRQDLRRKMIAADAEVMDAYRRIQNSRAKKKTPTKKEKDMAYKALKEREQVIKQLEAMGS